MDKAMWLRRLAMPLALITVLVSLMALYAKLYFWGGTQYAPAHIKAGIWFLIAAGPLAAGLSWKKPIASLCIAALQIGLVVMFSV